MWRSILAVIVLPSLTAAQTQPMPSPPPDAPKTPVAAKAPGVRPPYRAYTFFDGIRRGTDEEVAVQVLPTGFVTMPKSPIPGVSPLTLDVQPDEGLSFGKFKYPKAHPRRVDFRPEPGSVAIAPIIRFHVHAEPNAALGPHLIKGTVTFQAIHDNSAPGPVEQIEIQVPVTVVERDAPVHKAAWPFYSTPVGVWIGLILLAPLLLAVLPIYLICIWAAPRSCPD